MSLSSRPGWAALAHRDFAFFVTARFFSGLAVQMLNIAVAWLVYDVTGSALALGLVGLSIFLPNIVFALVTGHVADRYDRRLIIVVCYSVMALASLGLLCVALQERPNTPAIFALVALFGSARAFSNPASQAMVPSLVPRAEFGSAIALNSSVWQTSTIAGPALGGILYAAGATTVFAFAAFCFVASLSFVAAIRTRPPRAVPNKVTWETLLAGLTYIRGKPVILGAISLDLFAVLLGGATALLPIYARDILHVGPVGLGVLRSMPAIGAATIALILAYRPISRRSGPRMFQAVAAFGLATIGFGLSTDIYLSLACLYVLGAADMVSVVIRQTLVQSETPDAMRGRVAAVNTVFIGASNELGEFESGALAALVGVVPAVVFGGVGTLAVAALWARLFPELRQRDHLVDMTADPDRRPVPETA